MHHSAPAVLRSATPVRERASFSSTAMNTLRKKLAAAALSVVFGVTSAQATTVTSSMVTAYELITDRDSSDTSRSLFRTTSDGTNIWRAGQSVILAENLLSSNWGLSTGDTVTWQHTLTGWTLPTYSGFSFTGGLLEISASGFDSWESGLVRVDNIILGLLDSSYFENNFTGGSITGFLSDGALNVSVTPWDGDNFQIYSSRLSLSYSTTPLTSGQPDGSDGGTGSLVGPGGIAGVPESNSTLLLVAGASVLLWRFARRKTGGVAREKLS